VGQLIGGVLAIFVLYALLEWAVFKRVMDDPVKGKAVSVIGAYVLAVALYGFGAADGGPWNPAGFVIYLPGLLIVGFFAIRRGTKIRDEADPHLKETFE
jgi:hypothetical protein